MMRVLNIILICFILFPEPSIGFGIPSSISRLKYPLNTVRTFKSGRKSSSGDTTDTVASIIVANEPKEHEEKISNEAEGRANANSRLQSLSLPEAQVSITIEETAADTTNKDLARWQRRLITREDAFSIHKLSSIAYTISSAIILGTGAVQFLQSPETFSEIPSSLQIPAYVFVASNTISCFSSVRMAFLHRRGDLTARNAFLGTAVSSLFSGYYFLWTSPFGPQILNDPITNRSFFAVFTLLNTFFIIDTVLRLPQVVESRRDGRAKEYNGRFILDAMAYVSPVAWGLPAILATAYYQSYLHDRPWFFEHCLYVDQVRGVPGLQPNLCYLQVAASLAASYGALFVTLRDKRLITKNQEILGITVFSVPALIWTVYGSGLFFQWFE